ncbi:MAG TPA: hypothetical protein VFC51_17225 [Chloroflexota bacterium]|nr:hypothetical protein [Chloroflexota bacterium]
MAESGDHKTGTSIDDFIASLRVGALAPEAQLSTDSPGSDAAPEAGSRHADDLAQPPLDVAAYFAARSALFFAAFHSTERPVRREPVSTCGDSGRLWTVPQPGDQLCTRGEVALRETHEGQQLVQAIREIVPQFVVFEHAGYYLDRLITRVYAGMRPEQRLALLKRAVQLAARDAQLPPPEISDLELVHAAAVAGIAI